MSTYVFVLFVAGAESSANERAASALRGFCDRHLRDRYQLTIADVTKQPHLADEHRILATPTLLKLSPRPQQRLIGHIWDEDRLLNVLDLSPPSASDGRAERLTPAAHETHRPDRSDGEHE